jgi:hypothetical protein
LIICVHGHGSWKTTSKTYEAEGKREDKCKKDNYLVVKHDVVVVVVEEGKRE